MVKILLTKQELKRQRENLERYQRFLPTLTLKKIQLQMERNRIRERLDQKIAEEKELQEALQEWIAVLAEEAGLSRLLEIEEMHSETENIAGVEVPVFRDVRFKEVSYDLYTTPFWIDRAVSEVRQVLSLRAEIQILEEQLKRLEQELRIAVQRVNLFEHVKIPEAEENIRTIQVFLGDQQTAAVVRGKISKGKAARRSAVTGEE